MLNDLKKLFYFVGLFCLGGKATFKSWPLWVDPYTTFSGTEARLGLCVGTTLSSSLTCEALGLHPCEILGYIHSRLLGPDSWTPKVSHSSGIFSPFIGGAGGVALTC